LVVLETPTAIEHRVYTLVTQPEAESCYEPTQVVVRDDWALSNALDRIKAKIRELEQSYAELMAIAASADVGEQRRVKLALAFEAIKAARAAVEATVDPPVVAPAVTD
jgi:hypothetical protein